MNHLAAALARATMQRPVIVAQRATEPACGIVERLATAEEQAAYHAAPTRNGVRHAVRVGDHLIDGDTGEGGRNNFGANF